MAEAIPFRVTIRRPAPEVGVLPIALCQAGFSKLLLGANDSPVWPVNTAEDRTQLEALAETFGGTTRVIPAREAVASGECSGQVIGVGDIEEETQLYAHLTGRSWGLVKSVDQISESSLPEVILRVATRLDAELVQLLFLAPPTGAATGIVWGRTREELARQVLLRAATTMMNGPVATRRVDFPDPDQNSAEHTQAALSGGVGVLTLITHGDGSSVRLTPELMLCAMDRPSDIGDRALAPACVETGFCAKVNRSVADALRTKRLLAPEELVARILVMGSCQTAFLGSVALDSAWGPLARLVLSPRIGAVLASPETTLQLNASLSNDLSQELAAGVPVGKALAEYDNSPTVSELGNRLVLFGDPRVRAAPGGTGQIIMHTNESHQKRAPKKSDSVVAGDPEILVLRHMALYIRDDMQSAARLTSRQALEALVRYESDLDEGQLTTAVGDEMRTTLLSHLTTMKARSHDAWVGASEFRRLSAICYCPNCEMRVRPYVACFATGYRRTLIFCPRCGVAADKPVSSDLKINVSLPRIEIYGQPSSRPWAAAIFLVPGPASETTMHRWPSDATGALAQIYNVAPAQWPAGPLTVQFVIISGTTLHAVSAPARAPSVQVSCALPPRSRPD
jgi:hypothetical protein